MGSCCSICFRKKKFEGEGHRLGTGQERTAQLSSAAISRPDDEDGTTPEPRHDQNLTDADRERIRAERAAAAEARLKKQAGTSAAKSNKKSIETEPLRGPNSQPLMRWTAS